ncbi:MAG TPA: metallopeptidase family protein [Gemmatimonadales bacterium]|nr:metallopeptidase family protein [Gemmatimonadales bacterium]
MDLADFEAMLREMCGEIPREYFDGVTEVVTSPRARPHPDNADIFTLGECVPLPLADGDADSVQSRIILYHGSFRALAETDPGFAWQEEAWETLTHELRHHLEWRAQRDDLGALDDVMEANFRRHAGEPFDPLFYLGGVARHEGWYEVGDDWFLDVPCQAPPTTLSFVWRGSGYAVELPAGADLPTYLVVDDGVADPPDGELILVVRRPPRLRDLFTRRPAPDRHLVTAVSRSSEVGDGLRSIHDTPA